MLLAGPLALAAGLVLGEALAALLVLGEALAALLALGAALALAVGESVPAQSMRLTRQPLRSATSTTPPPESTAMPQAPYEPNMAVPPGPSA